MTFWECIITLLAVTSLPIAGLYLYSEIYNHQCDKFEEQEEKEGE